MPRRFCTAARIVACRSWRVWTDPAKDEEHISWARKSWEAMRPFAGGSVNVNYLDDEGDERVREAYGPNYDRLVALKKQI
jgi:hypothetical protein